MSENDQCPYNKGSLYNILAYQDQRAPIEILLSGSTLFSNGEFLQEFYLAFICLKTDTKQQPLVILHLFKYSNEVKPLVKQISVQDEDFYCNVSETCIQKQTVRTRPCIHSASLKSACLYK